jgi:glycosyltransferase involved in cell wall biosynthesis
MTAAAALHVADSMNVPVTERVAVIIPVYHAAYLSAALASALRQTRPPDEVIVIDDGAPDRQALADALAPHAHRLRLLSQANRGAGAARNAGIRASDASLVAFLDADDEWLPDYLERQLATLAAHPECDVAYADATFVGDTALQGRRFSQLAGWEPVTATSLLALRCHIPLSGSIARRDALCRAELFDESLRRGQDFDLWLRLALRGASFAQTRRPLVRHRVHGHNLSGSQASRLERARTVFLKALETRPLTTEQRTLARSQVRRFESELALERGKELLQQGDVGGARHLLEHAHRTLRRWKVGAALLGLRIAPHLVRRVYMGRLDAPDAGAVR